MAPDVRNIVLETTDRCAGLTERRTATFVNWKKPPASREWRSTERMMANVSNTTEEAVFKMFQNSTNPFSILIFQASQNAWSHVPTKDTAHMVAKSAALIVWLIHQNVNLKTPNAGTLTSTFSTEDLAVSLHFLAPLSSLVTKSFLLQLMWTFLTTTNAEDTSTDSFHDNPALPSSTLTTKGLSRVRDDHSFQLEGSEEARDLLHLDLDQGQDRRRIVAVHSFNLTTTNSQESHKDILDTTFQDTKLTRIEDKWTAVRFGRVGIEIFSVCVCWFLLALSAVDFANKLYNKAETARKVGSF